MNSPVLRRPSSSAFIAAALTGLSFLFAPSLALADGLTRLDLTSTNLSPTFAPTTTAYTGDLPTGAAATAVHTSPDAMPSRLFLQPANAPWQQVALGATVAAGASHSLVLRIDGSVIAWGSNSHGQTTIPAAAQAGVTALAAGATHSLALGENGGVIAWGNNASGQCTVPVAARSGIVAIAAGGDQSLALTATGAVIAWGGGATASLPSHLTSEVICIAAGQSHGVAVTSSGNIHVWGNTPQPPLQSESKVIAVAAAANRTLALRRDGTILAWGYASTTLTTVPDAAQGAVAIAASATHNFALRADGSVFAWSDSGAGPLDPPATTTVDVVALAAGGSHVHALKRDGSLITWGSTSFGLSSPPLPALNSLRLPSSAALPVGYGTNRLALRVAAIPSPASTPVPLASLRSRGLSASHGPGVALSSNGTPFAWDGGFFIDSPAPTGLVAVSAGVYHGLAINADGSLRQWGSSGSALLAAPADALDLVAIAAAPNRSLALRRDGRVVAWGPASTALLTIPETAQSGVVAISAGYNFNLALRADGSVVQWGSALPAPSVPSSANSGVVAIASATTSTHAFALKANGSLVAWGPSGNPLIDAIPSSETDLIAISVSSAHGLALRGDGRVVAWGSNSSGQCTVPIDAQTDVVAIVAGNNFSLAVKTTGALVAWGAPGTIPPDAQSGLLIPPASSNVEVISATDLLASRAPLAAGDGFNVALRDTGSPVVWPSNPYTPAGLAGLVAVASRDNYILGLRASGSVVGWASNSSSTGNLPTLTLPPSTQSGVVALAAGASHALALKTDGTVVAWGNNSYGQTSVPDPNPVTTASNSYRYRAIAASNNTSFGLRSDGRVIAWGSSEYNLTTIPLAAQADVVALAAGYRHVLALKRDGSVVGWGSNSYGEATGFKPATPVVALVAGETHSLFLHADGSVSTTGDIGASVPANLPSGVLAIAAGRRHASVLKANGTVVSWGNFYASTPSPLTVLRPGPPGADYRITLARAFPSPALSALRLGAAPLTPAFTPETTFYTQSVLSDSAVLGLALEPAIASAHVQIRVNGAPPQTTLPGPAFFLHPNGPDVLGLTSAGGFTSTQTSFANPTNLPAAAREGLIGLGFANGRAVGLSRDGTLVAWWPGSTTQIPIPSEISRGIAQIASTEYSVLLLGDDGLVREWSPGSSSLEFVPSFVGSGVVRIAARGNTRLALLSDGSVRSWGNINPPPPAASSGVVAIHAGDGLAFAQKADGTVLLWGNHSPLLAEFPSALSAGFISLVADYSTAHAVLGDGSVVSWGEAVANPQPPAAARSGVVALSAAGSARAAQKADGTVVFWNTSHFDSTTATLPLASPRVFPLALRPGANRVSVRVSPLGRPLSVAPIATGYYRHYAVTPEGAVTFRNASTQSLGSSLPPEAASGIASVFSGAYGDYALTAAGRLVALNGAFVPYEAQPSSPGETPVRAPVASLAVGNNFAVLLRTDGSTHQWGSLPSLPADALNGIVAVAAGRDHALALRADGRVVGWGYDSVAALVPGGAQADVVAIAAADRTSLALKADGSVIAWGSNTTAFTPPSSAQSGVVGIALNEGQALALKPDGAVVAWGVDATQYPPPASVSAPSSGVVALFASGRHQIALKADGSTVTWGRHMSGGTLMPADFGGPLVSAPVRDYHLAVNVTSSPKLLALGSGSGALDPVFASATTSYALPATPYPALALSALSAHPGDDLAVRVGSGAFAPRAAGPALAASYGSLLALRPDGTVRAFAGDSAGSLPTSAQSGVAALSANQFHAVALKRDGSLVAWGQNYNNVVSAAPTANDFVAVAAGFGHSLALRRSGTIAAWGSNSAQQLLVPAAATDCVAVSAGEYTSMALRRDGAVVAWGRYTPTPQTIPADAQSGVVAIAAGRDHYLALRADGRLVQWGNLSGFPEVPPARFVAIAAFRDQNIALRANGEIVTWGGFSGPYLTLTPANSTGIVAITAGPSFAAALRADGSLVTIPAGSSGFSHFNGTSEFAGPFALPISASVPLALGDNTVELRVTRPGSELPPSTYALNIARLAAPGLRLGAGTLAQLANTEPYFHNFGLRRVGATSPAQVFTLLNTGTADLVVSSATLSGSASADFALSGLAAPLTLAPGASTSFTIAVTPSIDGVRIAGLLLGANLPHDEPFGFTLRTEGTSYAVDHTYWRTTQFFEAELADPALEASLWGDLADPDGDGIPNLLEYATGTDAEIANAAPAPVALDASDPAAPRLTLTYKRRLRAAVGGMTFRVEWSDDLASDSWSAEDVTETVTGTLGFHETVVASVPADAPRRFLRLRVTAP